MTWREVVAAEEFMMKTVQKKRVKVMAGEEASKAATFVSG
jgi:hypothetical protein